MALGRNDPCPCGSGKKVKKCHAEAVGDPFAVYEGWVPPMTATERTVWKNTGCPFGACENETDAGEACAARCGV